MMDPGLVIAIFVGASIGITIAVIYILLWHILPMLVTYLNKTRLGDQIKYWLGPK